MNTNDKKFEQQDHPLKNTDNAFVKVGKDGAPVIPETSTEDSNDKQTENLTRTVDDKR